MYIYNKMGFLTGLFRAVPRLIGGLFRGGAKPFAAMAAQKAKEAAINLAKQKAAEAAASAAKAVAEKTGITNLVGQGAVDSAAGGLGGLATQGVDAGVNRVFQK